MFINKKQWTWGEKLDNEESDGAYVFRPEWRDPLPKSFGKIQDNVVYQGGQNVQQWTMVFDDPKSNERAIAKLQFTKDAFFEF